MIRTIRTSTTLAALACGIMAAAQTRYLQEVFTNAQTTVTQNVYYATNIDFLTSNFSVVPPVINTVNLMMDIYQPDQAVDTEMDRPVVIYIHTGNLLPPPLNQSPTGTKRDSSAVEICKRMARRGYVAVSIDYRLGWNPAAPTVEERRGQLLNAVYRSIHDTKECVRKLKYTQANGNPYHIAPNKFILFGEGTGGYIALAYVTLDHPSELYIEKFRPDPFDPTVSYVDSNIVGNIHGFGGQLNMYQDTSGFNENVQMCVNLGGALADTSWMAPGDVPMVAVQTVRDDFAPFDESIVYVPFDPPLEVVVLQGSNIFIPLANAYGNNDSFATLPGGDPFTDRARALYGTTWTVANPLNQITIASAPAAEGLFPVIRTLRPWFANEASPWQWWDCFNPPGSTVIDPGPPAITACMASLNSNPDMSANKGRTYIDTIMGYASPRIVCALQLGPCSLVGISENEAQTDLTIYPNPASEMVTVTSTAKSVTNYDLFDMNGRLLRSGTANAQRFTIARADLKAGAYFLHLHFADGSVVRKLMLD